MTTLKHQLHVGAGTQIGPVTAFPVWSEAPGLPLSTPQTSSVEVSELADPVIGELSIAGTGPKPVLVTEGTLLGGGWQTRVTARDAIVMPGERIGLETACVEAGRWGGELFHTVKERVPVRVIGELRGVCRPRSMRRDHRDRQGRVWASVDGYQQRYGQRPTSSLAEVMYDDDDQRPLRRRIRRIHDALDQYAGRPLPGQNGIVVALAGQPLFLEAFASEELLRRSLPTVMRGIALDAVHFDDVPTPSRRARRFAERLMAAPMHPTDVVPHGRIFAADIGNLDVRALEARLPDGTRGNAHLLAINSHHDLVLAA